VATDGRADGAGYSPQLDGLRALSVAAVAYSHWLPGWQFGLPLGAGVHLFFVLSGFLITRILLSLRDAPRRGSAVARFYARRALRLCPAFYLVLATAWLADVPLVRETWAWHAAYLSNVRIAAGAQWLGHVSHFWSLAVEEQFYLLWPWLMVWSPRAWLGPLLAAAVLAGPASRFAAASLGLSEPFWALVPAGSADSLAVGALVAYGSWRQGGAAHGEAARWPGRGMTALAGIGWIALAVFEAQGHGPWPALAVWRQLLQGVVFAWVVQRAVTGFGGAAGRLLAHPWLVYVGRISYGVYLIHAFAPLVLAAALRAARLDALVPVDPAARAAAAMATTLVLAAVMWRVVESPFQRMKARL
jgi:peptidoglycan/LPS O-acetylase OafA/YrhL